MTKMSLAFVSHFFDVQRRLEKRLDGPLSNTFGISFETFQILQFIDEMTGEATRADLAKHFIMSESQIVRKLLPLTKIGLITTAQGQFDGVKFTDSGSETLANARKLVSDTIDSMPQHDIEQSALEDLVTSLEKPNPPVFGNRPRPKP